MDGNKPSVAKRTQAARISGQITEEFCDNLSVLVLVQGVLTDGKPHHAYIRIPQNRYREFKLAEQSGDYDLRAFGEVVHHGEGLMPPDDICDQMKKKYGANQVFLEDLIATSKAMDNVMFQSGTGNDSTQKI